MIALIIDAGAVVLAFGGSRLLRRRGQKVFWLAAAAVIVGLWGLARLAPSVELSPSNDNGFGASGLDTVWFPVAALVMALCVWASAWRRVPQRVGFILGVIVASIAWLVITGFGFWIS